MSIPCFRSFVLPLSLVLTLAAPAPLTQDRAAPAAQDKPVTVDSHMKAVNRSFRAVKEFIKGDKSGPAPLDALREMQRRALEAKNLEPKKTKTVPAAEQAACLLAFRKEMKVTIVAMLELELALLEKNWAEAEKLVTRLEAEKKEGHNQFKAKGKDDDGDEDKDK